MLNTFTHGLSLRYSTEIDITICISQPPVQFCISSVSRGRIGTQFPVPNPHIRLLYSIYCVGLDRRQDMLINIRGQIFQFKVVKSRVASYSSMCFLYLTEYLKLYSYLIHTCETITRNILKFIEQELLL